MRYHTPKAAAALLDISVSSLRNYCATYKAFLSADASPAPGSERRLSEQDVAILQRVVELKRQGMTTDAIVEALQTEDTTTLQPYIDAAIEPATPPEAPQGPQQAIMHADVLMALQSLADDRYSQLRRRIDDMEAKQGDRMTVFVLGIGVGILLTLAAAVLVWLGMVAR